MSGRTSFNNCSMSVFSSIACPVRYFSVASANKLLNGAATILAKIETSVQIFVTELTETDIQGIVAYWESERGVPSEFDGKLLPKCRTAVGRDLERAEIKHMRTHFQRCVKVRFN